MLELARYGVLTSSTEISAARARMSAQDKQDGDLSPPARS
jgi:hypothetical protein